MFRSPCAPSPEIHRTAGPSAASRGRQTRDRSSPWPGARSRSRTGPAHLHRPASPLRKLPEEALGQNEGEGRGKGDDEPSAHTGQRIAREPPGLRGLPWSGQTCTEGRPAGVGAGHGSLNPWRPLHGAGLHLLNETAGVPAVAPAAGRRARGSRGRPRHAQQGKLGHRCHGTRPATSPSSPPALRVRTQSSC